MSSLQKIPVSLLISFLYLGAAADPVSISAGAGEAGMAYTCIMKRSFWSSFHNQAALPFNTSFSAGFNYENRFGISELSTRTAAMVIPSGKASFGAEYSYFGYPDFRREMAGIGCGMKLGNKIAAGVQADYFSTRTPGEYGNHDLITCEAGLLFMISPNTTAGVHVFNPLPQSLVRSGLPLILRAGAGTMLTSSLFAAFEAEMDSGSKAKLRTGMEYQASGRFWLRTGFCSENSSFSFGAGYISKNVTIDIGFVTHEVLGITSSASLIFRL